MGNKTRQAVVALLAVYWTADVASAEDARIGLRAGVERISGDYGGGLDVQDLYAPLSVLFERGRFGFRATVPYLEIEFIDSVDSSTYTESGLGDIVLGFTVYDFRTAGEGDWSVDFTANAELGTADDARGLGNGEADYTLLADARRELRRGALIVSAGYKFRGEPAGVALEDGWIFSVGGIRRFSAATSGGLFLDYREASLARLETVREVTVTLSRRLGNQWRIQAHMVRGLTASTLDVGAGISIRRDF